MDARLACVGSVFKLLLRFLSRFVGTLSIASQARLQVSAPVNPFAPPT